MGAIAFLHRFDRDRISSLFGQIPISCGILAMKIAHITHGQTATFLEFVTTSGMEPPASFPVPAQPTWRLLPGRQ
jgi:hypothetical protein